MFRATVMRNSNSDDQRRRTATLLRYGVFEANAEVEQLELLRLLTKILEVGVALVTVLDTERVTFHAAIGTTLTETAKANWFCTELVAQGAPLMVECATEDPRFLAHALVTGAPRFRFYAGYPLVSTEGIVLGALCVLDDRPRANAPRYFEVLAALTKQVMAIWELRLHRRLLSEARVSRSSALPEGSQELPSTDVPLRQRQLVGTSPSMRQLLEQIDQVAQGDWTVLIEGETGAGKELVAQAIHHNSARRNARFVPVNCAGLTESILGSQLFGHLRGAFTGATADQVGFIEAADGGTLFLDEIGDISSPIQSALLRVLQEHEITRLGETRSRKVNVRVITATNQNLRQRVKSGLFRQDLYYRIRSARIRVAPLRDRREDIPLLVDAFLSDDRVNAGRPILRISDAALRVLSAYDWPGNVRELRGALEYAVCRCRTTCIDVVDLPVECVEGRSLMSNARPALVADERARIVQALRRAGGSKVKAAKILGIGRATLYRRLTELEIDVDQITGF